MVIDITQQPGLILQQPPSMLLAVWMFKSIVFWNPTTLYKMLKVCKTNHSLLPVCEVLTYLNPWLVAKDKKYIVRNYWMIMFRSDVVRIIIFYLISFNIILCCGRLLNIRYLPSDPLTFINPIKYVRSTTFIKLLCP